MMSCNFKFFSSDTIVPLHEGFAEMIFVRWSTQIINLSWWKKSGRNGKILVLICWNL